MKTNAFAFVFLLAVVVVVCSGRGPPVNQCLVPCHELPCNWREPKCCDSGFTASDPCGCCARGLQCLRICDVQFGKNTTGCFDRRSACVKTRWIRTFQFVLKTLKVPHEVDAEYEYLHPIKRC